MAGRLAVAGCLRRGCVCPAPARHGEAQGDGPHNLPLIPIGTNIFTPQVLVLSGNFNPARRTVVPGARWT